MRSKILDLPACPWCEAERDNGLDARQMSRAQSSYRCPTCDQLWIEPISANEMTRAEFEAGQGSCPHCGERLGPKDSRGPIAGGIARGIVGSCSMCGRPFILQFSVRLAPSGTSEDSRFECGDAFGLGEQTA